MSRENEPNKTIFLGIDAGGTFTDFVLLRNSKWSIHKVLSTPDNPAKAILQGISELGLDDEIKLGKINITHGSTVATNAALERKGAKTAYVTNKGFGDVLTIARQERKELYNLHPKPIEPPVPDELIFEIDCRRGSEGEEIQKLDVAEINQLLGFLEENAVEAVAINFLFSFINDEEEKHVENAIKDAYFTSRSSFVLPKYKEYERGMATWLNASLGPKVNQYMNYLMRELDGCALSIMQSSGGTISAKQAARRAVNLLLSGPAGGLSAVKHIAKESGYERIISFDMGGTSTDVALMSGDFELTDEGKINEWPVAIPMLKMETIGAGGGSIAWLDQGNMLHVGPQSAGSKPGPVCYDLGGEKPTVTDANLFLGRLQANQFLGGRMTLNANKAERSIADLAREIDLSTQELAEGIIELAEEHMVKALQAISIQKGHNPQDFTLCCFGGAGGMHVCSLAEKLGMSTALVPARSGVLSAFGMLTADKQRQYSKTHVIALSDADESLIDQIFKELEENGRQELEQEASESANIIIKRSLDLRYQGQSFTLTLPYESATEEQFHIVHQHQYGHQLDLPVELVNIGVSLSIETHLEDTRFDNTIQETISVQNLKAPTLVNRDELIPGQTIIGPTIIYEEVSTTWLKEGWTASVDTFGHLHLAKGA